jgi:hypothetical protein
MKFLRTQISWSYRTIGDAKLRRSCKEEVAKSKGKAAAADAKQKQVQTRNGRDKKRKTQRDKREKNNGKHGKN